MHIFIVEFLVALSLSHENCNNAKVTSAAAADELSGLRARILVRPTSF